MAAQCENGMLLAVEGKIPGNGTNRRQTGTQHIGTAASKHDHLRDAKFGVMRISDCRLLRYHNASMEES